MATTWKSALSDLPPGFFRLTGGSEGHRWTRFLSVDPGDSSTATEAVAEAAAEYLYLPCSIIHGAIQVLISPHS